MEQARDVTELLAAVKGGDADAHDALMRAVLDELRVLASAYLANERPNHTLQPTALINEAYLRLLKGGDLGAANRSEFFALAARAMRRVLVDHARSRGRLKRGAGQPLLLIDESSAGTLDRSLDLVTLDEALRTLSEIDARKSNVVELRFFGGLTIEEVAKVLAVSPATVKRDWEVARAWLYQQLMKE